MFVDRVVPRLRNVPGIWGRTPTPATPSKMTTAKFDPSARLYPKPWASAALRCRF